MEVITNGQEFFDKVFQRYQNELCGSEAETVIMKRVAAYWYAVGRVSITDDVKKHYHQVMTAVNEAIENGNLPSFPPSPPHV